VLESKTLVTFSHQFEFPLDLLPSFAHQAGNGLQISSVFINKKFQFLDFLFGPLGYLFFIALPRSFFGFSNLLLDFINKGVNGLRLSQRVIGNYLFSTLLCNVTRFVKRFTTDTTNLH
jgi:hypothetical protein